MKNPEWNRLLREEFEPKQSSSKFCTNSEILNLYGCQHVLWLIHLIAGSVESAYWLVWGGGGLNILGHGGGEPLALL